MFKSAKRKVGKGKEKADFKLEFHTSRVPQRGWDKLLVSLISLETGKVIAKTGKASVKNGNCQWADPLYESAKVSQDAKGKDTDKVLYKIVVSTGLSRFGILGETTINLVDHMQAIVPTSLSLPLLNCNSGSILHVKIQRLLPKAATRDLEDQKDTFLEQDTQSTGSDDHTELDLNLPANKILDGSQLAETKKQSSFSSSTKDESFAPSTHRYSSDSLDTPSTPGVSESHVNGRGSLGGDPMSPSSSVSSFGGRHESAGIFTDFSGLNKTGSIQELHSELSSAGANAKPPRLSGSNSSSPAHSLKHSHDANDRQMDQWNSTALSRWGSLGNTSLGSLPHASENGIAIYQETSHRRGNSLSTELEAAEVTIEELRREASSWEQHVQKLGAEVETLKQQLADETKRSVEMQVEMCALVAERDSINLEVEKLKSAGSSSAERETGQDMVWREVEDARNSVKELQDELAYENSVNLNLNLQLQKTQESNAELLLEIQDLEESLLKKNKEIEEYKGEIISAEKQESIQKLQASEIQSIQNSERKGLTDADEDLRKMVDTLRKELDELERDSQELTEENIDLMSQLKQANDRLNAKDHLIGQLESKTKLPSEQSLQSSTHLNKTYDTRSPTVAEADELRVMVNDLREKLRFSEESYQSKLASSRTLLDDLNSSVMVLRSKNSHLERQLQCSEDKVSSLMKDIESIKNEKDVHEREKSLLASQRGQLKGLRERATKAEQEYANILKQTEELDAMNTKMKAETGRVIATLEQELKSAQEQVVMEYKRYADAFKVMGDLQAEKDKMSEEISGLLIAKEAAEATVTHLEKMNAELQEQLQHEQVNSSKLFQEVQEHEAKFAKLLEELHDSRARVKEKEEKLIQLETIREEMEIRLQDVQEENRLSRSHIQELELQLSALDEGMHSLQESRSAFEAKGHELQSANDELSEKLNVVQEESRGAREHADTLVQEIRVLKAEMESAVMMKNSVEHLVSDLESRKELLQNQVENLTEENMQLEEKLIETEAQYRNAMEEKDAVSVSLQDVENRRKELEASLQTVIKQQQHKIYQSQSEIGEVFKEAEANKKVIWDLKLCIENMKHDIASKEHSQTSLQDQLQKFKEDNSASAVKIALLNDELLRLHRESEEKENRLSGEIEALVVSKQELKMKADKTEDMLRRSRWEKASAVERLQQEIQQLNAQKSSSFDDKERLEMQALSEASQLRAEKGELEEKLWNLQEMLRQADINALSLRENLEFKVDEAMVKELEMEKRLEEALKDLEDLRREKLSYQQKMLELESQCAAVEEEKQKNAEQVSEIRNKIGENEFLQMEIEKARSALLDMKLEKAKIEASFEKVVEELTSLKGKFKSHEEAVSRLKQSKAASEEKISRLQEVNAKGARRPLEAEQRNELIRLRKQTGDLKRKLSEQEMERDELKKRVSSLEEELQHKASALAVAEKKLREKEGEQIMKVSNGGSHVSLLARSLSRTNSKVGPMSNISPSRDAKELADLRGKVKLLEDEVKKKAAELEASKQHFKEKQAQLCDKIEHLEAVNEKILEEHSHSNVDELVQELNGLQNQNAVLFQRENEILSRLGSQEVLQKELEILKEEKNELENALSRLNQAAKGDNIMKRIVTLETELAEVLEANNMYKSQLQSAFAKQQNVHAAALENLGSVDQVIKDLAELKRKNAYLEEELSDMRERYLNMSLQFAEVEAEREELVMALRNLRNGRKLPPYRSVTF